MVANMKSVKEMKSVQELEVALGEMVQELNLTFLEESMVYTLKGYIDKRFEIIDRRLDNIEEALKGLRDIYEYHTRIRAEIGKDI
jgi:hypothetical protein